MARKNKLRITAQHASILLTMQGSTIVLRATQVKPGFFNEHVTMEVGHADAVRLYLWLQEEIGKEEVE